MTAKEILYKLIRISLGNESDLSLPKDICYSEIMELSEQMGMSWLVINGLQILINKGCVSFQSNLEEKMNLLQWIGLAMKAEQQSSMQWDACRKLVDLYAQHGITTIGLKGMTVAQWYQNPMHRFSCDFDCFLLKEDTSGVKRFAYEEGNQVVEARGVNVDRRIYVHSVFDYQGLTVENHHYLAAVKLNKRNRNLDAFLRKLLEDEPLQPVMDSKLMMGSPMFNAIFLTHHAHRHFLNEYMPIKLLTDWALFVRNNPSLNWQLYQEYVNEFGMLRFAQSMTRLADKLLGVSCPFELSEDVVADELLENSLWDFPVASKGKRSLFSRRVRIIGKLIHSRKKYKVFYDSSSLSMIIAYIKGHFFDKEV